MSSDALDINTERARLAIEAIMGDEAALRLIGQAMKELSNDGDGELLLITAKPLAHLAKILHAADVGALGDLEEETTCRLHLIDVERSSSPEALNHPDGPMIFLKPAAGLPAPEHVVLEVDLW